MPDFISEDWPTQSLRDAVPRLYDDVEPHCSRKRKWVCYRCGIELIAREGEKQNVARKRNKIPADCDLVTVKMVSET